MADIVSSRSVNASRGKFRVRRPRWSSYYGQACNMIDTPSWRSSIVSALFLLVPARPSYSLLLRVGEGVDKPKYDGLRCCGASMARSHGCDSGSCLEMSGPWCKKLLTMCVTLEACLVLLPLGFGFCALVIINTHSSNT